MIAEDALGRRVGREARPRHCDGRAGRAAHRSSVGPTKLAGTSKNANRHASDGENTRFAPRTTTSVPPVAGPDNGPAPVTVAVAAYETAAPSAVKSAPFALTSTITGPLASAGGAS